MKAFGMKTLPGSAAVGLAQSMLASSEMENIRLRERGRLGSGWLSAGFIGLVLLGIAAYLYLNLFVLPDTPVLQSGDQVFFWMDAQRMLHGERVYLDFFQYTPPGTDLVFLTVFKLFGPRIWALNAVVLALGVALCWVCLHVASQILERDLALLATCLYLVLIFNKPLTATHHWFSVLVVMCAAGVIIAESSPWRVAIAGGLLGLASFFTQTHGIAAVAGVAAFLVWEQSRRARSSREVLARVFLLLVGFASAVLMLNAYFIASAGAGPLWYQQVTYVLRYAGRGPWNFGLPEFSTWRSLPRVGQQVFVYLLLPVVYLFALGRLRSDPKALAFSNDRKTSLLALIGVFLLAEVALSPNWLRIYAVSMPGIILAIVMVSRMGSARRNAVGLIWAGIACLAFVQLWARHHHPYVVAEWPGGTGAVSAEDYEELHWITQHTRPGEFFFQAIWPGMYLPLDLRNPLFLDAAGTNEQTRPEYVELAIGQLEEKKVRYVVWSQRLDDANPLHAGEDHLGPLRAYLHSRYNCVRIFPDRDEVWERR
jgi:hypothetical protein